MGPPPLDLLIFLILVFAAIIWAIRLPKRQRLELVAVSSEPPAPPVETVTRVDSAMTFLRILYPKGPWVLRKAGKVTVADNEADARAWLEKNLGK